MAGCDMAGRIWRTAGVVAAMGLILGGVVRAQTGMPTSAQGLDQGWDASQKQIWYSTSQGSRLIPYAWLTKLEAPEGGGRFLDDAYFSRFHYLPGPAQPDGTRLPAGFVLDTTPDAKLTRTALRWTANQGDGAPWVGMNCSACHTGQVVYHNPTTQAVTALTVEGGPTGADFQGFIGALDAALNLTLTNADRFDRFAQGVLGSAYPADKDRLRTALAALVARQNETARQNQLPGGYHYGYGRLDAIGNIYNKVQIAATPTPTPSPPNAPVSYPFLWNVPQHDKVQWDGIAPNDNQALLPLLRNGGEVIGVFGDIELKGPDVLTFPSAYRSSLNARGLMALEAQLHWLKPPRWPDEVFGAPDKALVNDGLRAYARNCVGCHSLLPGGREDLHSQIKAQMSDLPSAGTDIGMACNAFTRRARSGVLAGTRYSANSRLQDEAFVSDMLLVTVAGGLKGQDAEVIAGLNHDLLDKLAHNQLGWAHVNTGFLGQFFQAPPPLPPSDPAQVANFCLTTKSPLLAYKGRPLYGVWATAPFLHNGSVRTLWDLMLPPASRPTRFWTGNREFDPERVGFVDAQADPFDIEFTVNDAAGRPIPGNSNLGHDYGNARLSDHDRWAIIAYIKAGLPNRPL